MCQNKEATIFRSINSGHKQDSYVRVLVHVKLEYAYSKLDEDV